MNNNNDTIKKFSYKQAKREYQRTLKLSDILFFSFTVIFLLTLFVYAIQRIGGQ